MCTMDVRYDVSLQGFDQGMELIVKYNHCDIMSCLHSTKVVVDHQSSTCQLLAPNKHFSFSKRLLRIFCKILMMAMFKQSSRLFPSLRQGLSVAARSHQPLSRPFSIARPLQTAPQILLEDKDNGFGFIRHNTRPPKPRSIGVTEIRGPYYSAMGKRYLQDVLETYVSRLHLEGDRVLIE